MTETIVPTTVTPRGVEHIGGQPLTIAAERADHSDAARR